MTAVPVDAAASPTVRIGTAGWSIPRAVADRFDGPGAHLDRYARVFGAAEIDSSFKHEHRASTYARWAAATPPCFLFAVKLPHEVTHRRRLDDVAEPLDRFLGLVGELGDRLGPLLLQLPPSFGLDVGVVETFFGVLRRRFDGAVVCEPRHADWFTPAAERLLTGHRIGRVAADPARVPGAERPGGWLGDADRRGVAYFRQHGAPVVYRSSYAPERIAALASEVRAGSGRADVWCIFDNTASGAAAPNALELMELVERTT